MGETNAGSAKSLMRAPLDEKKYVEKLFFIEKLHFSGEDILRSRKVIPPSTFPSI